MTRPELFTPAQLNRLRAGYAMIGTVDPCGKAYGKIIALLDGASQPQLKQLAGAGIKFVSRLAANRVQSVNSGPALLADVLNGFQR